MLTPWDRAGCPRYLSRHRIPCSCPFQPGLYTLPRLTLYIPKMEGILEMLAKVCSNYVLFNSKVAILPLVQNVKREGDI